MPERTFPLLPLTHCKDCWVGAKKKTPEKHHKGGLFVDGRLIIQWHHDGFPKPCSRLVWMKMKNQFLWDGAAMGRTPSQQRMHTKTTAPSDICRDIDETTDQ